MSKFKVGEAKTTGGYDAFIFEITGERIFGRINDEGWRPLGWLLDGRGHSVSGYTLLPNNEPLRAEFEQVVKEVSIYKKGKYDEYNVVIVPEEFYDKRVKVTLESLE